MKTSFIVALKSQTFSSIVSYINNSRWLSRDYISDLGLLKSLCRCLSPRATLVTWSCFKISSRPKYLSSQNNIVVGHNISFDLFRDILIYAYNIDYRMHNVSNAYNYLDPHSIATYIHNSIAISNIICLIYIITLNAFALIEMLDVSSIKCIFLIHALYFHEK